MEIFWNVNGLSKSFSLSRNEYRISVEHEIFCNTAPSDSEYRAEYIDPSEMRENTDTESRLVKKVAKRRGGLLFTRFAGPLPFPLSPLRPYTLTPPPPTTSLLFTFCPSLLTLHSIKLQQLSGPADQPFPHHQLNHNRRMSFVLFENKRKKIPVLALRTGSPRICRFATGSNLKTLGVDVL